MLPIGCIYPTWHPHQTRARVKFHSTKLKTAKKSRSKAAQTTPKKSASMAIVEAPTRVATPKRGRRRVLWRIHSSEKISTTFPFLLAEGDVAERYVEVRRC